MIYYQTPTTMKKQRVKSVYARVSNKYTDRLKQSVFKKLNYCNVLHGFKSKYQNNEDGN